MSRTVLERHWGNVNLLMMDAPAIAARLTLKCAPGLMDYLLVTPGWLPESQLYDAVYMQANTVGGFQNWKRLLWALEVTGVIEFKVAAHWADRGVSTTWIRISLNAWLREVQRRAAARADSPVSV